MNISYNEKAIDNAVERESNLCISVLLYATYKHEMLVRYLEMFGVSVTEADSEKRLIDLVADGAYDLIITDLPENGENTLSFVRSLYAFSFPTPIIVVSDDFNAMRVKMALDAGAYVCFSHTTSYEIILSQIQALLRFKNALSDGSRVIKAEPIMRIGNYYTVNRKLNKLFFKDRLVNTNVECVALIGTLAENLNSIVSINTICLKLYGTVGTKPIAMLQVEIKNAKEALAFDSDIEIIRQYNVGYGMCVTENY